MLVLATNRPQDLDVAVLDRVDVSIPITPPAEAQRLELVRYYMAQQVTDVAQKSQTGRANWLSRLLRGSAGVRYVDPACLKEDVLRKIAVDTKGFSGREIAKMFIAAQYAMFLAENSTLTVEILLHTVALKVEEHHIKKGGFSARYAAPELESEKALQDAPGKDARGNGGGVGGRGGRNKGK
jgi:SpoVK/Ycf46/Vps4 family AAA+-type ATPase